ncbi:MAG: ribosomal RNA small subunit methyltransferase A [Candidatus Omnitrophica bacterium]|nr:ribosomal RNA small subunit methyltransferase A [Candidatus Omnitrophota bacterium]
MNQRGQFFPKKSLGQNFLINPNVIKRIIASCDLKPTDTILEIGPGKGALTHALSEQAQKVIAIEKDDHLAAQLTQTFKDTNVDVIPADILKYPFDKLPSNVKIIGNLPYNIATPIIEKAINYRKKFYAFYMTVQLEYGQRITAGPDSKSYGSLSCFVQYYADTKILFKIKNSSFQPIPKVQSCFLQLNLLEKPKHKAQDEKCLFKIIRACFGQRRKTIANTLSTIVHKEKTVELLKTLDINPKLRAENISLKKYVQISNVAIKKEEDGGGIFIK